jgi:hypothetical protein
MGSEDEVEQSNGRFGRQTNGRSEATCELTSSIVPRGASFHRSVEFEVSFGPDVTRVAEALRFLALENDTSLQALAIEAFNDLLKKYGKRAPVKNPRFE